MFGGLIDLNLGLNNECGSQGNNNRKGSSKNFNPASYEWGGALGAIGPPSLGAIDFRPWRVEGDGLAFSSIGGFMGQGLESWAVSGWREFPRGSDVFIVSNSSGCHTQSMPGQHRSTPGVNLICNANLPQATSSNVRTLRQKGRYWHSRSDHQTWSRCTLFQRDLNRWREKHH